VLHPTGAGDEIRTHDPNLGKVAHIPSLWYPAMRDCTIFLFFIACYEGSIAPSLSDRHPMTYPQLLGMCFDLCYSDLI
jgi:hypothetical protein